MPSNTPVISPCVMHIILRGPLEEVHVGKLLHLLYVDGADHLLIVVEHPFRSPLVGNFFLDEGDVMSAHKKCQLLILIDTDIHNKDK